MDDDLEAAERILDAALALGEVRGWDALHLHDVAREAGLGLPAIQRHYRQKDDLAEAWFDRAERALVQAGEQAGFDELPVRERLRQVMLAWFDALAPHRGLTLEMLRYKLQPDHWHLQVAGVMRISRTVQWIRETARLPSTGWRRELEEVALTGIFVSTVGRWALDGSPDARRTRDWLDRRLAQAERLAAWPAPATAPPWTRSPTR